MSWKKVGDGKYRVDVERNVKGKRRRKSKRVKTDLKGRDLNRFLRNVEDQLYDMLNATSENDMPNWSFVRFADYVIKTCKATQNTKDGYMRYLNCRTRDYFGDKKLVDIKLHNVQSFIDMLESTVSPATKKPLSAKTIKHYRDLIRYVFNRAKKLKIVDDNPADDVETPKVSKKLKGTFYEIEELAEVLPVLENKADMRYHAFFIFAVFTGCRPSEIYGLKWGKIDFSSGLAFINEALVKTTKGYIQKPTKTEDERIAKLPPYMLKLLSELKTYEMAKHKSGDISDKYVFTNAKGEHLNECAFRKYLKNFCARNDLPYVTPYGLRHTTGTILAAQKVPTVNIAKKLGHTSITTTQKYIHPTIEVDDMANEILEKIVTPKLRLVK